MLCVITLIALSVAQTIAGLKTCQSTDFKYEYTECDGSGGRWRVQVPKTPNLCEGGTPTSAVRGKSCNFKCEKGQYLDISGDQKCKPCPPGSYSLGDGVRYEEWNKIPEGFLSTADSFNFYDGERQEEVANCTKNEFTPKGTYLSSLPGQCNAQLAYSITLVNPGTVYFEYQFPEESGSSALFHFTVQNNQCDELSGHNSQWPDKTSKGKWGHTRATLKKGLNVLKWRVVGIGSHHHPHNIPVLIRKIEITGVGFTSECSKCRKGTYSSSGAEICTPCKPNTYSGDGADICQPCDLTKTYSYEGASNCTDRPACTTNDYYQYQLPCIKGKTQKTYEWIQPQICRKDLPNAAQLPEKTPLEDCPACNPGMFMGENGCQFCPEGQMSEDGKTPCKECTASTSPDYKLKYNWWNTLPSNMSSECIVFDAFSPDSSCRYNSSWIPNGNNLQTQFARGEDAYLLLIHQISGFRTLQSPDKNKIVGTISFDFSTTCTGKCVFVFIVERNGESVVQKDWTGSSDKTHYSLDLTRSGPVSFSWAFQRSLVGSFRHGHVAESDTAHIYSISISNSLDGGAVGCQKCPKGVKNDRCVPCPPGHYIHVDANATSCEACPANTIVRSSKSWGSESCEECGQGLKASSQGDTCITDCKFTDPTGRQYDFAPLNKVLFVKGSNLFTGSGTKYYHGFNISLCGGDKMVTCSQNVSDASQSKDRLSYAPPVQGVVCRSTIIPSSEGEKSLATQPTSLGDYITKIVVNKSMEEMYKKEGLPTEGVENDIHFYSRSKVSTEACPNGRSTIISLRCDQKLEGDGEIVFPPKCIYGTCDGCDFHLMWKTMYACPNCRKEDFTKIIGECNDGSQQIHYSKPDHCRGEAPAIETKKCAIKFPFIVKIVVPPVVILGLVLLICVIYCWQRNKSLEYKYMKLVHNNEPNYEGELPGVDSCALSDGEEDQFDSVQFKESRGSKFFNKLRGKKTDKLYKDDENPFETGRSEKIPLT